MDHKMMMPTSYTVLAEEELTYTCGGDSNPVNTALSSIGVPAAVLTVLSIGNLIWGVSNTRQWVQQNKKTNSSTAENLASLAVNGIDDAVSYASKSVWNAIVGVYTTMNLLTWWPVTAIAWITA